MTTFREKPCCSVTLQPGFFIGAFPLEKQANDVLAKAEQNSGGKRTAEQPLLSLSPEKRSGVGDRLAGPFVCLSSL